MHRWFMQMCIWRLMEQKGDFRNTYALPFLDLGTLRLYMHEKYVFFFFVCKSYLKVKQDKSKTENDPLCPLCSVTLWNRFCVSITWLQKNEDLVSNTQCILLEWHIWKARLWGGHFSEVKIQVQDNIFTSAQTMVIMTIVTLHCDARDHRNGYRYNARDKLCCEI